MQDVQLNPHCQDMSLHSASASPSISSNCSMCTADSNHKHHATVKACKMTHHLLPCRDSSQRNTGS